MAKKLVLRLLVILQSMCILYYLFLRRDAPQVPATVQSVASTPAHTQTETRADDDFYSRYTWSNGSRQLVGKRFNVRPELLRALSLPPATHNFIELSEQSVRDFVFVTGVSSNHFGESKASIALVQKYFPNHKIYYYDLGLNEKEVHEVRRWCGVKYTKFDFSLYPKHVKKLKTFSFKPIIMNEVLRGSPGLFWIDSSIRFQTGNLEPAFKMALKNGGFVQFSGTGHSVFGATDPAMWEYLAADPQKMKRPRMNQAGVVMLYKTRKIYDGILHWYMLCALDVSCITPPGSSMTCPVAPDLINVRVGSCHRQDQSALNTLAANLYNFTTNSYLLKGATDILTVQRSTKGQLQQVQLCS